MKLTKNQLATFILAGIGFIAIVACIICNLVISGSMAWASIVMYSIILTLLLVEPLVWKGWSNLWLSLIILTIFILPFLYILSVLINVEAIFNIGLWSSLVSLVALWTIYILTRLINDRPLKIGGIAALLALVVDVVVNFVVSNEVKAVELSNLFIWIPAVVFALTGLILILVDNKKHPSLKPSAPQNLQIPQTPQTPQQ